MPIKRRASRRRRATQRRSRRSTRGGYDVPMNVNNNNNAPPPPAPPMLFPDLQIDQWAEAINFARQHPNVLPIYTFRVRPGFGGPITYNIVEVGNDLRCQVKQGNRMLSDRDCAEII